MTDVPSADPSPMPTGDRLLCWREVRAVAGLSRTTAWRLQNRGDFPCPVAISPGRVAWRESDVSTWKAGLAPRGLGRPGHPPRVGPAPAAAPAAAPAPQSEPPAAFQRLDPSHPPTTPSPRPPRRQPVAVEQICFDF